MVILFDLLYLCHIVLVQGYVWVCEIFVYSDVGALFISVLHMAQAFYVTDCLIHL
jgi:hypothetical protein